MMDQASWERPYNSMDEADLRAVMEDMENLANQVRNLANQLEEHMHKPDAHNPGILRKK